MNGVLLNDMTTSTGRAIAGAVEGAQQITVASFAAVAVQFVTASIAHMVPWLIVTAAVIVCDLVTGIRKSLLMGEAVRFSMAVRRTMGKMITYFSFVVMIVLINDASGGMLNIDMYACLLVCFIEGCSIISNILKAKGLNVDFIGLTGLVFEKALKVKKEDVKEVLKPDNNEETETKGKENKTC